MLACSKCHFFNGSSHSALAQNSPGFAGPCNYAVSPLKNVCFGKPDNCAQFWSCIGEGVLSTGYTIKFCFILFCHICSMKLFWEGTVWVFQTYIMKYWTIPFKKGLRIHGFCKSFFFCADRNFCNMSANETLVRSEWCIIVFICHADNCYWMMWTAFLLWSICSFSIVPWR